MKWQKLITLTTNLSSDSRDHLNQYRSTILRFGPKRQSVQGSELDHRDLSLSRRSPRISRQNERKMENDEIIIIILIKVILNQETPFSLLLLQF